jgi:hypothetical protein
MSKTLTSANSQFILAVPDVLAGPVPIQGFATDDAFSAESFSPSEVRQGVDGKLSAGFTPQPKKVQITLQADSDSNAVFDAWYGAMDANRETYPCTATFVDPSTGMQYTGIVGWLTDFVPMPPHKKVQEPRVFSITFQDIIAAPL